MIYKTKFDSLYKINQWNSIEVQHIYDELRNNKDDFIKKNSLYKKLKKLRDAKKDLTPQARVYQDKIDSIVSQAKKQKYRFIEKDNSLVGYSMLLDELFSNKDNKDFNYGVIKLNLDKYQSKFKNHPFTASSTVLLEGIENNKIGNDYVDFSSKTKNNEIVKVSSVVKENTATLIDLWAP